ncbi:MAG: YebC/PmpR family DNA-binding transcriptional regulator [Planctomycetota bacterium]|nr:YebC/PmpR family DNA-binding transcriptional regulator [Planctomycetota bacterium]
MAGHSRWANIKHKKAKSDAKRGKLWSKAARAIMAAARNGVPDPAANLTLRYAIEEAKAVNMPRDTIERAIKKGSGEIGGDNWENVRYEGYGPGGVAIIIDALTNNRTRTAGDVRLVFTKFGGNLGAAGAVAYMFEPRGRFVIDEQVIGEEKLMELALEAGADDVSTAEGYHTVLSKPADFIAVKDALDGAKVACESAELTMIPTMTTEVTGDNVTKVVRMIDAFEDLDDVQKVYSNLDASDEALSAAME